MFLRGVTDASILLICLLTSCIFSTKATPLEPTPGERRSFSSSVHKDVSLRFVADSGVCETTPGVHQKSGYITVGKNMSMVRLSNFANRA